MSRADLKSDSSKLDKMNDLIILNTSEKPVAFSTILAGVVMSVVSFTSTSCQDIRTGYSFWNHRYMTVMARFTLDQTNSSICLNSDCSITLINDLFIKKHASNTEIQIMTTLVPVGRITGNKHMTDKYIMLTWYFLSQKVDETWALFKIEREVHIMTGLCTNMLVEMNVMGSEWIDLITSEKHTLIESTGTSIPINYRLSSSLIRWIVQALESTTIESHFKAIIPVQHLHDLLPHDYIFSLDDTSLSLYTYLTNEWFNLIVAQNDSDEAVTIGQRHHLRMLTDIEYDNCYHVNASDDSELTDLTVKRSESAHQSNWYKQVFTTLAGAVMLTQVMNILSDSATNTPTALLTINLLVHLAQNLPPHFLLNALSEAPLYASTESRMTVSHSMNSMILLSFNFNPISTSTAAELSVRETVLPNSVTIHSSVKSESVTSLTQVVEEFHELWEDSGKHIKLSINK